MFSLNSSSISSFLCILGNEGCLFGSCDGGRSIFFSYGGSFNCFYFLLGEFG